MVSVQNILCGPSPLSPSRLLIARVSKTAHQVCMDLGMVIRSSSLVMSGDPSFSRGSSGVSWALAKLSSPPWASLLSQLPSSSLTSLLPAWTQTLALLVVWNQDPAGEWDSRNIRVRVKVFQPCLHSHLSLVPHSCLCFSTSLHVAGCSPDAFFSLCFSFPFSGSDSISSLIQVLPLLPWSTAPSW